MEEQGERRMGNSLEREFGGLDARVTMLERRVAVVEKEIKAELRSLNDKNDRLNEKIDVLSDGMIASRSGWKAIAWFVGLMATAFAVISTLSQLGIIR